METGEIRRLIRNQSEGHSPHSFRTGGAGMADFARLAPVLRSLPTAELGRWMRFIEKMRAGHDYCPPCSTKILAFCVVFTRERLPELSGRYNRLYVERLEAAGPSKRRDYFGEVVEAVDGRADDALACRHAKQPFY